MSMIILILISAQLVNKINIHTYIENIWVVWQRYLDQSIPGFALRKLVPDAGLVSRAAGVRGSGGGGPV